MPTSSTAPRASPTCSTSTCTWSTKSPARRRSTACGSPAAPSAGPTSRSPPWTTTSRPIDIDEPIADPVSRTPDRDAAQELRRVRRHAATRSATRGQGIVHVIGPELGLTQPGMTIVCGDSHTSTHGAFGALAFGIGTSEVEHVLATQTLPQQPPEDDGGHRRGRPAARRHGQGHHPRSHRPDRHRRRHRPRHRVPRRGDPRPVDGRPHDGLQHVDRSRRPRRADRARRDHVRLPRRPAARAARAPTGTRPSPTGAASPPTTARPSTARSPSMPRRLSPYVTWGTNPGRACRSTASCPSPDDFADPTSAQAAERALDYMGLAAGTPMRGHRRRHGLHRLVHQRRGSKTSVPPPQCSKGRKVADGVQALVVPGSDRGEGAGRGRGARRRSSRDAGAEWREAGCCMCLAMNPDKLTPGRAQRVDQQPQLRRPPRPGRPDPPGLPAMAAAAAVAGHFADSEDH